MMLFKLDEEKFSITTKEEWSLRYNNASQCEKNYLQLEPNTDNILEQTVVTQW
jgi:hypothetical protein